MHLWGWGVPRTSEGIALQGPSTLTPSTAHQLPREPKPGTSGRLCCRVPPPPAILRDISAAPP